jgi:nicotinamidase/pyrazinamidase
MSTLPDFYHPESVGALYVPGIEAAISQGQAAGLPPASADELRTILLLVDPQVDFIHTNGSLSVPGAIDDTRRTIEWIVRNAEHITAIAASLDSHTPTQIFYPTWWIDSAGNHPEPFTIIAAEDVEREHWRPVFDPRWSLHYVHALETKSKKELMIWPYHTMIGTPGHSITPALYETIAYHSAARHSQPSFLTKGSIPKTEHYSLLEPEVKVHDHPQGSLNLSFLQMLNDYDRIYVAGQAKSHCVLETITSAVRHYEQQRDALEKWHILMDCTSSVAHPEIDFDAMANRVLEEYAGLGLHLVRSTDPVG